MAHTVKVRDRRGGKESAACSLKRENKRLLRVDDPHNVTEEFKERVK